MLTLFSLEKTGITEDSVRPLLDLLPHMPSLISLNLSSNPLGSSVLDYLASLRCRSLTLRQLDLSNCKLTDKLAIKLLHFVLNASSLESVNLSRNLLGFKTGAFLMNLLVAPEIYGTTHLRICDLRYNTISVLLQNSIDHLLSETVYALSMQNFEATSTFENLTSHQQPLLLAATSGFNESHFQQYLMRVEEEEQKTVRKGDIDKTVEESVAPNIHFERQPQTPTIRIQPAPVPPQVAQY